MADLTQIMHNGVSLFESVKQWINSDYKTDGKSLAEWADLYRMPRIKEDSTPIECAALAAILANHIGDVSTRMALARSRASLLKQQSNVQLNQYVVNLVTRPQEEKKRLPNKETVLAMAGTMNTDLDTACLVADLELSFWKDMLEYLTNVRRAIETLSLNLSVDLKASQMEGWQERLANKSTRS